MAEPSERAGLTDEPLSVAIAKWIPTSVSGMTIPATAAFRFEAVRMTTRKMAVKTISRIRAFRSVMPVARLR